MKELILFFLCNIFLIISTIGYIKFFKIKDLGHAFIFGIIIYYFRILVFELVLGYLLSSLNYLSITIISCIEFALINFIFYIRKENFIKDLINKIIQVSKKKITVNFNFNFVIFCVFFVTFIIVAFIAIFIYEYSFDGNYYHLPHIIDYVQAGKIYITNNTLWNDVYPQNIELLNMFNMLFTKSIVLVRVPQIMFSLLGIVVVYNLMKILGFKKDTSYRCSMLYFVAPFILAQITTTYLDGIVCTLLLTLIYSLILIIKSNDIKFETLFFITLSIFMGTKGTCIIYAIILISVYLIFKVYCIIKKKENVAKLAIKWIVFSAVIISIGCTWMIQNVIIFKNPIHPFKFMNISGLDANKDIGQENEPLSIKGKSSIEKVLISWVGLESSYLDFSTGPSFKNLFQTHDTRIGGLGIEWLYFLVPLSLISLYLIVKKDYKLTKYQILVIAILMLCFILTPGNWWGRYVGFIIFIGFIGYGIFYEKIKNKILINITNLIYIFILIFSIIFCCYLYTNRFIYEKPYGEYNSDLTKYINSKESKNIVLLEESYCNTQYFVYLKGNKIQNKVDTYFIEEMYPNAKAKNHNIGSYENFYNIVSSYKNLDAIVILDASKQRQNFVYAEKYYEDSGNYTKKLYGEDIVVYEKNN